MVAVVAVGGVTRVVGDQFELRSQRVDLPDAPDKQTHPPTLPQRRRIALQDAGQELSLIHI